MKLALLCLATLLFSTAVFASEAKPKKLSKLLDFVEFQVNIRLRCIYYKKLVELCKASAQIEGDGLKHVVQVKMQDTDCIKSKDCQHKEVHLTPGTESYIQAIVKEHKDGKLEFIEFGQIDKPKGNLS